MLTILILLLGLVIVSSILQKNFKIPSPITLICVIMVGLLFDKKFFTVTNEQFDMIVLLTLPLLIATDALKLKFEDLKEHGLSLFWVAVVAVVFSVGIGVLINGFVLSSYSLSIPAVVMLFCMLSATDPITVSAIFQNFNVPHKLKVLTEGESLFNDATALIVFSLALIALQTPASLTVGFVAYKSLTVIFGAIVLGLIFGYLTTIFMQLSEDPIVEFSIILLFSYISYVVCEKFHFSGILGVIVTVIMAKRVIQQTIDKENTEMNKAKNSNNFNLFRYSISSHENQNTIIKTFDFMSIFAAGLLFVSIASVADLDKLFFYKNEIFSVFIATTLIRAITMLKFALVSNSIDKMQSIKKHWWYVITFSGAKGGLSILMVHLIPSTFHYKELFENIVIGNVVLSTIIYAIFLGFIFAFYKNKFAEEFSADH